MNKTGVRRWLCGWLLVPLLAVPGLSGALPPPVASARHAPMTGGASVRPTTPRSRPSLAITLPPPERPATAEASATDPHRPVLGVGRTLSAPFGKRVDPQSLVWTTAASGGQSAGFTVVSEGAMSLRVAVAVRRAPAGTELAFYPAGGDRVLETVAMVPGEAGKALIWSPLVSGDGLGVEVRLAPGAEPADLDFSVPLLSHGERDVSGEVGVNRAQEIGRSAPCNLDVACDTLAWWNLGSAVAKITVTDSGGTTWLCSGVLLNDREATGTPYFITARHCVEDAVEAATLNAYWNFRSVECGKDVPGSYQQTVGGAELLSSVEQTDFTFLRLNSPPPGDVVFAGWNPAAVGAGIDVTGIHHPQGDLQKISHGITQGYSDWHAVPFDDGENYHLATFWSGTTEKGSSGSGLFRDSDQYLVGILSAGPFRACSLYGEYYFGRFDRIYPAIAPWLESRVETPPPPYLSNISGRASIHAWDAAIIGGFIVGGEDNAEVVIKGLGPSMADAGLVGPVQDPWIELYRMSDHEVIGRNDNWGDGADAARLAELGHAPGDARESALLVELPPGAYTVVMRGHGEGDVGLVSVDDLTSTRVRRLVNVSVRSEVGSGEQVLIGGFIVEGSGSQTVLVSALGPGLSALGVAGALADPVLEVYRQSDGTLVDRNDDWIFSEGAATIATLPQAPTDSYESALLLSLTPGAYTAVVHGYDGGTGVGQVIIDTF